MGKPTLSPPDLQNMRNEVVLAQFPANYGHYEALK